MTFLFSYASHAGILVVLVDYAHPTRWKASGGGEPEKRDRLLHVQVGYNLWVTSLLLLSGLNIYEERSRDLKDGFLVDPSRREAF